MLGVGNASITIGDLDQLAVVFMLYSAGFAALFLIVALLYGYAWRQRAALGLEPFEAWEASYLACHHLLFTAAGLISILLAAAGWGVRFGAPGLSNMGLGLACYVHGKWSEQRQLAAA